MPIEMTSSERMRQVEIDTGGTTRLLSQLTAPLALDDLTPSTGPWEVEIGFGKGRYLVGRAQNEPQRRFLGIEVARSYFHLATQRAARRSLSNLVLIRGEALFVIAALLPAGFARAVHVYFPDPWPKARHHRRRLFDPETVDLVLGLLVPGGELYFATDFIEYGELVAELLASHPGCRIERLTGGWPEGARTNYEAKYLGQGRGILRLAVGWQPPSPTQTLHPLGARGIVAATGSRVELASPTP